MSTQANSLADRASRRSALLDHDRSLLVEAGAGSGKTAIMAGRVALMLARGIAPKKIAAVTFTELAASELLFRIREFVAQLGNGDVPIEVGAALPNGISPLQRENLAAAERSIDELTCTTIHGFCQRLIKPYPVEADIDPGAGIMDADQADLAFQDVVEAWLRETLDQEDDSLLAELVMGDTDQALALVSDVLAAIRHIRNAPEPSTKPVGELAEAFVNASREFDRFVLGTPVQESESENIASAFNDLAASVRGIPPTNSPQAYCGLLLRPPNPVLNTKQRNFRKYRTKGKWGEAARRAGFSTADANQWFSGAAHRYEQCCDCWQELTKAVAQQILADLVKSLQPVAERYREYKRSAALLDFDDLIVSARDLLRDHEGIRRALAERFAHVLVDEFQDTDPLQAEIFWHLCGNPPEHDPPNAAEEGSSLAPNPTAANDQTARDVKPDWIAFQIRPGALFLVGDPKQAIYRFRGADVAAYIRARDALRARDATSVLSISTNFRSLAPILDFVNQHFKEPLSTENGQPGFTALDPFHADRSGKPRIAALDIAVADEDGKASADEMRDGEAERVAEMCARLIGGEMLRDQKTDGARACRPGDIALLAPTGTSLWRYEAALERRGIPVATQAGKGLFRRQEIQDLIALTRVLADHRDTLAFGALLRGPLVGLTEEELLDIVWALPRADRTVNAPSQAHPLDGASTASGQTKPAPQSAAGPTSPALAQTTPPRLTVLTPPETIRHDLARDLVEKLQSLRGRANATTPHHLLAQAVDALRVRPILIERHHGQAERALANVDLFLSFSRNYAVRGLRAFADAMTAAWSDESKAIEGRPDAQEEAVALYTMHAAKGLEWPIVMPINTTTGTKGPNPALIDRDTGTFHRPVFGVKPPGYQKVFEAERDERARENKRLWYVATTRARELLVLPRFDVAVKRSAWLSLVDLSIGKLPALELPSLSVPNNDVSAASENTQSRAVFAQEAEAIENGRRRLVWRAPSRSEGVPDVASGGETFAAADVYTDNAPAATTSADDARGETEPETDEATAAAKPEDRPAPDSANDIRGSLNRGRLLHKLIEEVLTGETADTETGLQERAATLIRMMGEPVADDPRDGLAPAELAASVRRALSIPEIAALRSRLLPEYPVYAAESTEAGESIATGVADAIAFDAHGQPEVIVDWKTDVAPTRQAIGHYRAQVQDYLAITNAPLGLIVFVTTGTVLSISGNP